MRTDAVTIPQLIQQVELLKDPLQATSATLNPIMSAYDFCREAQRVGSIVAWQESPKAAYRSLQPNLNEWRKSKHRLSSDFELLSTVVAELLAGANDLLSFALVAAEAGQLPYTADCGFCEDCPCSME